MYIVRWDLSMVLQTALISGIANPHPATSEKLTKNLTNQNLWPCQLKILPPRKFRNY